jgi:predicted nuclease of predicted toxin-antitoxin system
MLLYSNENFPFLVVAELRRFGHDVTTVRETGKANRATPDTEILEFAVLQRRALLTLNRKHFIALHASRPQHAGIVVCTVDADFIGQARRIHEALAVHADLAGQLIRVNRPPDIRSGLRAGDLSRTASPSSWKRAIGPPM